MKLCDCGCGGSAPIAAKTVRKKGWIKGQPKRFICGHHGRKAFGVHYAQRSIDGVLIRLHRLRAEKALGKPLPKGAEVHHADGSRNDDAPLVICQDESYHKLLHARMRVIAAGGNPNTDAVCAECKTIKNRSEFTPRHPTALGVCSFCKSCNSLRERGIRRRKKQEAEQAALQPQQEGA